jgi:hypothetical protein
MGSNDPKISQIQTNFQALSTVASSLNAASDELTKVVGKLDEALKKLNVGLTVWVVFEDRSDEQYPDQYDCDQIGYCKVNGKWGISLRRIWGHEFHGAGNEEGPWHFTDAPREMRLRSVDKIPVLIEALSKEASNTTKKIQEKTKEVSELAAAIESAAYEQKRKSATLAERVAAKANLLRQANAGAYRTVPVPGGESPKAEEGSLADQVRKSIGKNTEGSK